MPTKVRVLKLGTECTDIPTGFRGTLSHWSYDMEGRIDYLLQPTGLNEEGQPLPYLHVCERRLDVKEEDHEEVEVPTEILGTVVKDTSTGFEGTAIDFMRHLNGCFHVFIQPKGTVGGKKEPIRKRDFDLRRCTGEMIKKLSEEERRQSERDTPSPTGDAFDRTSAIISSVSHNPFA